MIKIKKIRFVPRTLTFFKGTEQEKSIECTGVMVRNTLLINNLELFPHGIKEHHTFQTVICESDGIVGCEAGNWISVRKHKDHYFFVPAFSLIEQNPTLPKEYLPPEYMNKHGVYLFTKDVIEQILSSSSDLPKSDTLQEFTNNEIVDVFYYELFTVFFGKPIPTENMLKNTEVKFDIVGEKGANLIKDEVDVIRKCTGFELREVEDCDQEITLYKTDDKDTGMKIAVLTGNSFHLRIGDFKIVRK